MSSRYRLVALVGVVLLGAAIYAIYALMRDHTASPTASVEAYLDAWSAGDYPAMEALVVDPPSSFDDDYEAVIDDLEVTGAEYELTSVDTGGSTGIARYTATVELASIGEWTYDGTLSIVEDDEGDGWLVEWSPANVHPALGEGQHLARTREVPERAPILDAAGEPLSVGRAARVIGLEPRAVTDLGAVKLAFKAELDIDPVTIDEALNAPGVQPDHFVRITTVDMATYNRVEPVIYPLPGTRFRDTFLRGGPTPGFAAHVLGSYGEITAERLHELGEPYQAGDLVGLSGLEALFEEELAGTPSSSIQLVGADDEVVEEVERFEGREPQPVRTTIDPAVQVAVEQALGETTAPTAVVVVDAKGNVRAVASRPLGEYNRALAGEYPPGSTFKIVTTAALLADGVTPETSVECAETVDAGGRRFRNFERSSLGTVPFGLAFAESCNTAFISAAADISDDDLVAAAESFGFNTEYTVGLDTGTASFPTPANPTEHAAATIGQGRVTASPLHMATVAGTVIDGTWEPPVLLPDLPAEDAPAPTTLADGTPDTLLGLMRRVVAEGSGTAAAVPGADIAGKTGTAEYGSGTPPPTRAWFVGIRGDLAVAVLVEDGVSGGEVAAPIAGRVLAALPG
ncbi:MAG TPA: penicillin-binding transpeptidase domain-containing protein [Acidimicrobiales bacterium]